MNTCPTPQLHGVPVRTLDYCANCIQVTEPEPEPDKPETIEATEPNGLKCGCPDKYRHARLSRAGAHPRIKEPSDV